MRRYLAWGAAVLMILLGMSAGAQEPPKKAPPRPPTDSDSVDPTAPRGKMRTQLGPTGIGGAGQSAAPALPSIVLKGLVIVADQPPAVLLDLGGAAPILVGSGQYFGYGGLKLQVVEVSASAGTVRIDLGTGNELILR